MLLKKVLSLYEFNCLLDTFEDQVKHGEYKKIEYYLWRRLHALSDDVEICFNDQEQITISSKGESIFFIKGNPLANFFFDYYLPAVKIEKEERSISNIDLNTISAVCVHVDTLDGATICNKQMVDNEYNYYDDLTSNATQHVTSYSFDDFYFKKEKEKNTMNTNITFDFGPVNSNVKMSMYGMAIENKAGNYVSYDAATDSIIDVDVFQFDGSKFMYKIPAAVNSIKVGDVVVHQGAPCFVRSLPNDMMNTLCVVDIHASEQKEIMLPKSIYGFHYCTKVINLMDGVFTPMAANESNPFGNMLPFMLMSGNDGKVDDMLPLMLMMNQNSSENSNMFSNPMMMYMMFAKDQKSIDPMMMMLMMNQPHQCACGQTAKDNK